jgi:hypothetical protein
MCSGAAMGARMGASQTSQYSKNYGYGAVGQAPAMAKEERQWYMDQGFGDPSAVIGSTPARDLGKFGNKPANAGYYQGVTPEARYLYTQSSIPKTVYLEQRAPLAATSLGVPANTRYAGKALTINPMAA